MTLQALHQTICFYGKDNSPDIGNQIIPLKQARQLACKRTRVHQIKRKQRHDDKH